MMTITRASALLLIVSATSSADILNTFTDMTAFNNATNSLSTITFDTYGLADSDANLFSGFDTGLGVFVDGEILLTGRDHTDATRGINSGFNSSTYITTDFTFDGLTFVLDTPSTAFSLDFGTLAAGTPNLTATVEFGSGATFSFLPADNLSFLGFTLDMAEDEISIFFDDAGNEVVDNRLAFDNLSFGEVSPSPIPAPAAGLLAAIGIGAVATLRRRNS